MEEFFTYNPKLDKEVREKKVWVNDSTVLRRAHLSPSAIMRMMQHSWQGVGQGTGQGYGSASSSSSSENIEENPSSTTNPSTSTASGSNPVAGRQGKPLEVMGLLLGRPSAKDPQAVIITEAFPLPLLGFETRVVADDEDVINYMIQLGETLEKTRQEKFIGWYHSHPFDSDTSDWKHGGKFQAASPIVGEYESILYSLYENPSEISSKLSNLQSINFFSNDFSTSSNSSSLTSIFNNSSSGTSYPSASILPSSFSHPHHTKNMCFLSGTDIITQSQWQRQEERQGNPFLAIVICPLSSYSYSLPCLSAFRVIIDYGENNSNKKEVKKINYINDVVLENNPKSNLILPDGSVDLNLSNISTNIPQATPSTSPLTQQAEHNKIQRWGNCSDRFYQLSSYHYLSSLSKKIFYVLKKQVLWHKTFTSSEFFLPSSSLFSSSTSTASSSSSTNFNSILAEKNATVSSIFLYRTPQTYFPLADINQESLSSNSLSFLPPELRSLAPPAGFIYPSSRSTTAPSFIEKETVPSILERVGKSDGSRSRDQLLSLLFSHDEDRDLEKETFEEDDLIEDSSTTSLFSGNLIKNRREPVKIKQPLSSSSNLNKIEIENLTRSLQLSLCRHIFSLDDDEEDYGEKKEIPMSLSTPSSSSFASSSSISSNLFEEFYEFNKLISNQSMMDISN